MTFMMLTMVFFAALIQTLSGFGFALMVMPLLTIAIGFETAAPLVALTGLTLYAVNLIRYSPSINLKELARLGLASAVGVPVGFSLLARMEESTVKLFLGLIVLSYAAYSLVRPTLPRLKAQKWAYVAGFLAGCLGGAYNVPGPPAILYGTLRQWPKDEFRAVLQALFLLNAAIVVFFHYLTNHLSAQLFQLYAYAVPALLLGILIGARIDLKLSYQRFRTVVAVLLLGLGLSLALGVGQR